MSVQSNLECLGNNISTAENHQKFPFRYTIGHWSNLVKSLAAMTFVRVFKELVDGILERDFIKF